MSKRIRAFAGVALLLAIAWLILYIVSVFMVRPQIRQLERRNIEQNTRRAIDSINNSVETLKISNLDWSSWDETYAYVVNSNSNYAQNNLQDSALQNLNVNYMLIYDTKGKAVFSAGIDENGEQLPIPEAFKQSFAEKGKLAAQNETDVHSGVLADQSGQYIFSSGPIVKTDGNGPVHGTFVLARNIDNAMTSELSKQTDLSVTVYQTSSNNLKDDLGKQYSSLSSKGITSRRVSSKMDAAYQIMNDINGQPAFVLRVDVSRDLSYEAIRGLDTYLLVAGLLSLVLSLFNGHFVGIALRKQRTIELKDEFFSIASHELRTPLTAIKGNSQLAMQMYGKDNPDLEEMLGDIHLSSERLIRIVTNFLDAARLEQGRLPFTLVPIDTTEIVNEVVDELQGLAVDKKLYIHADISPHFDKVYADKDRLKQIISNLIGNAVKYTEEGGVTLTARQDKRLVIVSVNDTGRGISPSGKKALFSKFRQTRNDDTSKGSGLGLYITRLLVQKMGGTIWLESSEEGHGTTISFSVPIATPEQLNTTQTKIDTPS